MKCSKPYYLKTKNIHVPCGRCRACRVNRAQEWSRRLLHEAQYWDETAFITLTYDDQHAPGELVKRDAQLFIKRLRRITNKPIKYYLTGEYGESTGREHYHLILYGITTCAKCRVCNKIDRLRGKLPEPGTDCYALQKAWDKGIIHGGTVTPASTRYVADYLQKDTRPEAYEGRCPPFSLMSKGLGLRYQQDHIDLPTALRGIPEKGKLAPIPRYYRS